MSETEFHLPDAGLQALIDEYVADLESVQRRYRLSYSAVRRNRLDRLTQEWEAKLTAIPFAKLSHAAKIDYTLLRNHLLRRHTESARNVQAAQRLAEFLPFASIVEGLDEAMTGMETLNPTEAARRLTELSAAIEATAPFSDAMALAWLGELQEAIDRWAEFYVGYDPKIDWWIRTPLGTVTNGLKRLSESKIETDEIPGIPIGRDALLADLAYEMVPYSPEELIEIGEREYAWCLNEMKKAAGEIRHGDDWHAALESVKETYLEPGAQPEMVRDLAWEAVEFVKDLVSVPELAKESWRMEMMSPERQKVNPFFLGGETIIVSYPTDSMSHEEKRMSMRGNNPNFSRATVQHELIPGHHLQMFMTARFRKYRQIFSTPFWIEGWTLYWELLLWDLGFPRTPEERIGRLFWRMHRCVRVSFSLRFHLGELTTAECVEILVDRVGHERANAEGEVRRSFNGMYPPLYQAAYMIGGLQFRSLAQELVQEGSMSLRDFHDGIMRENELPPAMMRLALKGEDPEEGRFPTWHFDQSANR